MIETLESIDQQLLLLINGCHAEWSDTLFYTISQHWWVSAPFYILAIYLLYKQYGWKKTIICFCITICAIGLSDLISTECFKKTICRYRPTHNEDIKNLVHIVNDYRGGMYGFISSHAANMFAFATSISLFLREKKWTILFFGWSCFICYTRMYLGVHYPADILCGAIIGSMIAFCCCKLFLMIEKRNIAIR